MAKIGVKVDVIKSGPSKDSGSPFRGMTEDEKKIFQEVIDEYYEGFLAVVARGAMQGRGRRPPADRRRPHLHGAPGPESSASSTPSAISTTPSPRQGPGLAQERQARVLHLFPKTESNIYAGRLGDLSPIDAKIVESMLGALKAGFYYLWLPQTP